MELREHTLSWQALGRIAGTAIVVFLLWKALGAVIMIVIALVIAVSLYPLVHAVERKTNFSPLAATLAVFFMLLVPFVLLATAIIPSLLVQLPDLLANITASFEHIPYVATLAQNFTLSGYWQAHASELVASSADMMLTLLSAGTIVILSFYLIYDYERLLRLFLNIFPYKEKEKLRGLLCEVAQVTGKYIRGNVTISLITTGVLLVGLLVLRVPFALPLALFAGVLDLLPLVGSTLGSIPALLVAFSISPFHGFSVLVLHLVYQQAENGIISPAIYNKALNLYPALGFLAVIIGASLFGIFGAFLALPVAASIPVVVAYHKNYKSRHPVAAV